METPQIISFTVNNTTNEREVTTSHLSTIKAVVKTDKLGLDGLKDACLALGCTLQYGGVGRVYGGRTQKADYVVKVPGAEYDVLVTTNPDGKTASLATDFYNGSVAKKLGADLKNLIFQYQVHREMRNAKRNGYTVTKTMIGNKIKLTCTKH